VNFIQNKNLYRPNHGSAGDYGFFLNDHYSIHNTIPFFLFVWQARSAANNDGIANPSIFIHNSTFDVTTVANSHRYCSGRIDLFEGLVIVVPHQNGIFDNGIFTNTGSNANNRMCNLFGFNDCTLRENGLPDPRAHNLRSRKVTSSGIDRIFFVVEVE